MTLMEGLSNARGCSVGEAETSDDLYSQVPRVTLMVLKKRRARGEMKNADNGYGVRLGGMQLDAKQQARMEGLEG